MIGRILVIRKSIFRLEDKENLVMSIRHQLGKIDSGE